MSEPTALLAPAGQEAIDRERLGRYHVLDMGAYAGDNLARRRSLAALLFRLEHRLAPGALASLIDEVIGWFRVHPGYEEPCHPSVSDRLGMTPGIGV